MVAASPHRHKHAPGPPARGAALVWSCALALLGPALLAGPARASPRAELVVVGPGDSEYSLFGHLGLVLYEPADAPLEEAWVFNLGITDFNRPAYLLDFARGEVPFWSDARRYPKALERWAAEDRSVTRYPVNLPGLAAKALALRLHAEVASDLGRYTYDAFRENCATRVRDRLDTVTAGAVRAALDDAPSAGRFRDDVRRAYAGQPALLLLTELIPGPGLDAPRSAWALAYRPAALVEGLARVTLPAGPLLGPPVVDRSRAGPDPHRGNPQRAQIFLGLVAGVFLLMSVVVIGLPGRVRGPLLGLLALGSALLGGALLWVGLTSAWTDLLGSWLLLAFTPLDLGLLWTAGRLTVHGGPGGRFARGWLWLRLTGVTLLSLGGLLSPSLDGPIGPRLLALCGVALALRCAGVGADLRGPLRGWLRWPLGKAT